jgi:SAM-dependent methyltransferase
MSYWSNLGKHAWDELWMNHPAVRQRINRRITGDPGKWPIQWLPTVVPDRVPFRRALSIGCGVGNLERSLAEFSIVGHVTGIDSSVEAIGQARRAARERGMGDRISYVAADAREFLGGARDLDAVFFHASLHHFDRLSELLGLVRAALSPRGILYLDEYTGPARGEWTWRHLLRWNALYRRLPPEVRRTRVIRRPINRDDPTEAIESSGILPAVEKHFRVLARKDYGGNLLAPIYPSLLRPDQPGGPDPARFDAAVAALLEREERLLSREPGFNAIVVAEGRQD